MSPRTSAQALAETTSALLRDYDVTGLLAHLLRDVSAFVPADAAAILVRDAEGDLDVLSATSHRAAELEVYQAQTDEGPCVDVVGDGLSSSVAGRDAVVARWPRVGPKIVALGFLSVHAFPLRWHDRIIGGLNLFSSAAVELDDAARELAQAFADIATLVLLHPQQIDQEELTRNLKRALEGRIVVEQAKGALAYQLELDMSAAYEELLRRADQNGSTLTETANAILRSTQDRRPGGTS